MGLGFVLSGLLHLFFLVVLIFGIPAWKTSLPEPPKPIPIEIINISELSVAPPPKKSEEDMTKPLPEVKPDPTPEPEPIPDPTPEPTPAPLPEPIPEPTPAPIPEPAPLPEPEKKPEPTPAPEVKKQPELPIPPEKPKPPKKEEKEKASKKEKKKDPKKKDKKKEDSFFDDIEKALENLDDKKKERQPKIGDKAEKAQANEASIIGDELSISELDALKRQLAECWSPPSGMKDAETMIVELNVSIQPDGSVREVKIVDLNRYQSDTLFKPAADAARRAVLNPKCNPLKIPPSKYESLKTFILKFDPREMF
ncbi:MAG TPA: energy transducer TonB [Alphaproteobacteria bacterium]|nr:energy transducer TonB [Alphaproteobacteria bacterium]HQS94541.1 energy transducer TonB [Alphaproteobacteria bacterium]